MIETSIDKRVKISQLVEGQLPSYVVTESPLFVDFLKQYYQSQQYQGGPVDVAENIDQYIKLDNLTPEALNGRVQVTSAVAEDDTTIHVENTKGYPSEYGLVGIGTEIISYTGLTTNTFTGCIRGFSGITSYRSEVDADSLVFKTSSAISHETGVVAQNLSSLFLKEFFRKLKVSFAPGLEDEDFTSELDVNNFIKSLRGFYEAKGTTDSFRILFRALYDVSAKVVDLEQFLPKPSSANYQNRLVLVADLISGDPDLLVGQTLLQDANEATGVGAASAPISEVESFTIQNKKYYKISLFYGYDDPPTGFSGSYRQPGFTKVVGTYSTTAGVLTVDSTLGFPAAGEAIVGVSTVSYTDKTVNQFLGVTGIDESIDEAESIRENLVVYGYENGNLQKPVKFRLTGVLSEFVVPQELDKAEIDEEINVKHIGSKILNPEVKSYLQTFFNSWEYNPTNRIQVSSFNGASFELALAVDRTQLKTGDTVQIVPRETNDSLGTAQVTIDNSIVSTSSCTLSGTIISSLVPGTKYDLRRVVKKATSANNIIKDGEEIIFANVQNTYLSVDNKFGYVASNSLPDYSIDTDITKTTLNDASASSGGIQEPDGNLFYSVLAFDSDVPFVTGDEVIYRVGTAVTTIGMVEGEEGVEEGRFFVEVQSDPKKIKLYVARSFIDAQSPVKFKTLQPGFGSHTFTLASQFGKEVQPQGLLKKFPLVQDLQSGDKTVTSPGPTGMLINGVEIVNPRSEEFIYYGPVSDVSVLNGGSNFDVVNPPIISLGQPSVSTGTTALLDAVVTGSITDVSVDTQDFDITDVFSISVSGLNGKNSQLEPVIEDRYREVLFNASDSLFGGGISTTGEAITFLDNHNFITGQQVVYDRNGNAALGIGTFNGGNEITGLTLNSGGSYFIQKINNKSVYLYQSVNDLNTGINTIGFTTAGLSGIHKFRTFDLKKTLTGVQIINGGEGFSSRKLRVLPTGISTSKYTVTREDHGFKSGELVAYAATGGSFIGGLTDANQYYVVNATKDTFQLADAGVAGTIKTNYDRHIVVPFSSTGAGYQEFKYPDLTVSVNVAFANTVGFVTVTPSVRGSIEQLFLYEEGTDYGSKIIDFHKRPLVTVQQGTGAQLAPIVNNGRITNVSILSGGSNYTTAPDLTVSSSTGTGAKLRAVVANGRVIEVIIQNSGIGYDPSKDSILVTNTGEGLVANTSVRQLTVNKTKRFESEGGEFLFGNEINEGLQYSVLGYNDTLRDSFADTETNSHSPLIGWSYDGNPIYGSYGFSDPEDTTSGIIRLSSGYALSADLVKNRPTGFEGGFFIEDFQYTASGNLDEHNGRFCKTPDYPNGVYAYFATSEVDVTTGDLQPQYPYFIGDTYRTAAVIENLYGRDRITQSNFDFSTGEYNRNTYPYLLGETLADNDYVIEPYELGTQTAIVDNLGEGKIDSVNVVSPGDRYIVGEKLNFDLSRGGEGLDVVVSEIFGKEIVEVNTKFRDYSDFVFEKINNQTVVGTIGTYHDFRNGDTVIISGLSTFVDGLSGKQKVGVVSATGALLEQINAGSAGDVLDIEVSPIPTFVGAGSSIFIGNETFKVLNKIATQNLLRVERDGTGISTTGVAVTFLPNQFTISLTTDDFESSKQDTIFFNPSEQVSLAATAGISSTLTYTQGGITTERDVPAQAIYIPNHPFKTNQSVLLTAPTSADPPLMVRSGYGDTQFLPATVGGATTVFVVNIGKDLIGLKTTRGGDQLYFLENAANTDQYTFVSEFANVTGSVRKVETTVSTAATHGLDNGDKVTFTVKPEGNFGIGNSTDINLSYNTLTESVIVNNIGFNSTGINTSTNRITLVNHGLETGDKVVYDAVEVATGLVAGAYFVFKVDDNNFSLAQSYVDLINNPPRLVDMTGIGATHTIGQINPQIPVTRNKSLVFDTSDSSLTGFKLKFFYDKEFNNPVVSVASSAIFNIQETGVPGTTGVTTVGFSSAWPTKLYYNLEKTGYLSTSDNSVSSYNEINYFDSKYNGTFTVVGVGSTVFTVSLVDEPEETRYLQSDCAVLKYSTTSGTANGGISRTRIVSPGFGFETRPDFVGVGTTSNGINAILETESTTIGQILSTRVANQGFDYPSDKTLTPAALIPSWSQIEENFTVSDGGIDVLSGGQGFSGPPILTLVNSLTGEEAGGGSYIPVMNENSINGVEVIKQPSGIAGVAHTLYTLNNTNGIVITSVDSVPTGIVTCTIQTPVLGFTTSPILIGDKVFVDGIGNYDGDGFDGHNSKDHKFNFFTVQNVNASVNPVTVTYSLAGIATQSVGTAVTNTNNLASMVKVQDYPTFDVTVSRVEFALNQSMQVSTGGAFFNTDLVVTKSVGDVLKLKGTYELKVGDKLRGVSDGFICTIVKHESYEGVFKVRHDVQQSFGWSDKIGFTNDDLSVLPDNDYFQNLSYTVKTPLEWKDASGPMNRLLHSSGMKNFVDMEITSPVNAAAPVGIQSHIVTQDIRLDYVAELRADQINAFDLAVDTDVTANVSPAIEFANKKLSSFIKCVTNRVLLLDDISRQFSSEELNDSVNQTLVTYPTNVPTQRILVLSKDTRNPVSYQFNEFILMNTLEGAYILEKGQSTSNGEIVTIDTTIDPVENTIDVNASPVRTDIDYEFKVVRQLYGSSIGVGTLSVGIASVTGVTTSVGAATTTTLFDAAAVDLEGFTASVSIIRNSDQYGNYHEVVADRGNGDDVSMAEFGFDTGYSESGITTAFIGTFRSYIESGRLKLDYTNNGDETIDAKVRIVGLHKAGAGVGTASFKLTNQSEGSERSARYESSDVTDSHIAGTGYAATVIGVSSETHLAGKSIVRVAIGQSVNVSQLIFSGDYLTSQTELTEYPQLTIADTPDEVGLGTFGTRYNGSNLEVMFYPGVTSGVATITGYHELFYRDQDANADAVNNITYNVGIDEYVEDSFTTGDKLDFELTSDGFPVYAHVFNPNTASVLDPATGIFTIKNHFLNTGQDLVYTPESTIIGVSSVSVGIGSTLVGGGFGTGDAIAGFNTVSGLSTTSGMVVGQLFRGPGLSPETPTTFVVGLGNSVTWFTANSDGTKVLTGVGNTVVLELNETIESDHDYTGFGTITNIGFNSITVSNNVPAGVGSVYHSTRLRPSVTIGPPVQVGVTTFRQQYRSGINTDTMPENVYAIKLTEDTFKLATNEAFANAGIGVTFTSLGSGNAHVLDTTKKLEKSLITLDGINQAPITGADLSFELRQSLGLGQTSFPISGIASVQPGDLMKVGAEIMTINNVGLGTTAGDISGIGTFTVVNVTRGAVGTAVSSKTDGDNIEIYRGSYNIVRNKIHFTEAPAGAGTDETVDEKNLTIQNAKFGGRTFLRKNYQKNALFVDISNQFTGLARTFTLVTEGDANVGFETGSGVLFLNGIFQAPTTANNTENAYETISSPVGVTSAQFNGVRLLDGSPYIDEDDVNQNQIPRGGLIVSLGSTGGKGIAPLVGAKFRAVLSEGGGISQAVGVGTTLGRPGLGIVTASYTESTGILEVETTTPHKFVGTGENVYMLGLEFTCPKVNVGTPNGFAYNPATGISTISFASAHGLSNGDAITIDTNSITFTCTQGPGNHTYPRTTDPAFNKYLTISNVTANTFQVNVGTGGTGTSPHTFVSASTNAIKTLNYQGITTTTFPDGTQGHVFEVVGVGSTTIFRADVGISSIPHYYVGSGEVFKFDTEINTGSGYREPVAIAITDPGYVHRFVSAEDDSISVTSFTGSTLTPTNATYEPTTGEFILTIPDHGLTTSDSIGIKTGSIVFTCDSDNFADKQSYPRATDPIAGVITPVTSYTSGSITVNVGTNAGFNAVAIATVGAGGTLHVTVSAAGTGYVNPQFIIPDPSYSNLPIEGISRLGEGATTETGFGARITCEVGAGQTNVMSEHHFVTGFKLDNRGYAFRKGDVFRPVGLVTAVGVGATNFEDFELTVLETFTDSFSSWQFGELDYIDSIRDLQNGLRRRFPLRQNSQLISFQKDPTVTASSQLDLKNVLVIFIDGVIQIPGEAYEFDGGTSVVFTEPPSNTSEVDIFFYRGTSGDDSFQASVPETIKKGDSVTLNKKDGDDNTETQAKRLVSDVASSDKINTTIYSAQGVNDEVFRPLDWRKQKADKLINSEIVTKVRDSIEPQIYPVARLIGDISDGDTDLFVDSVRFFQYEEYAAGAPASNNIQVDAFIIDGTENVGAAITAVVGSDTTLTFDVTSGGSGYAGTSVTLGIAAPPRVDNAKYGIVGVGTTAIARGILTNGVITSVTIDNAGGGYNVDAPPQVIVTDNAVKTDTIDNSDIIIGYVGVITGISTTGGGSDPTSIVFETDLTDSIVSTAELDTLIAGYPIYVYDTTVGHGVTAVQGTTGSTSLDDMIVGIGTTFADAVYKVADITRSSNVGVITCHIQSTTNTVGLASTGTRAVPIGRFSWGRLGQVSRSASPVAFAVSSYTANSGLSTYPIVQRRGFGLRDTGALKKQVAN